VFIKFRRSSIFILPIGYPVAARKRSQHLISGRNQVLYDARILKGASMARFARYFVLLSVLLLAFSVQLLQTAIAGSPPAEGEEVILKAADITPKIFPERVFFRGQSAPVQFRNSGGVHFADDLYVLAAMLDSFGYSTAIHEKYQAYLLNEVTLEIGGQTLKPGAYGIGFINGR